MSDQIRVEIKPWGPDEGVLRNLPRHILELPQLQRYLRDTRFDVLSYILTPPSKKTRRLLKPRDYRMQVYDYTNNRTLVVHGRIDDPAHVEIAEFNNQPLPSADEFTNAVNVLRQHPTLGPVLADGRVQPYIPMPPYLLEELPDGRIERTLTVGLRSPQE